MSRKIFTLVLFLGAVVFTGASCLKRDTNTQGPMGMFRSSDKAENWQQANTFPTAQGIKSLASAKVWRVVTDPSDPNALYLTTRGQGVFYTYNNAESWNYIGDKLLANKFIKALVVDPKDKCTLYASDDQHIYKSEDCTRSWKMMYTEERPAEKIVALAVDYGDTNVVYAALSGGDVIMSRYSGLNWRVIKEFKTPLQHIATDPFAPGRLYVASAQSGAARTDDYGATWKSLSKGLDNFTDARQFYRLVLAPLNNKTTLFWLSKYGILRSDDAGETWVELKLLTDPGEVNIYTFAISPKNSKEMYYTGTILGENSANVRSTLYKSADGGQTWVTKKLPTNNIPVTLNIQPEDDKVLFMGFYNGQ